MFENILEDQHPSTNSNSIKVSFLQNQKEELSELIDQLNSSIKLNKETISKMAVLTDFQLTVEDRQTTFKQIVFQLNQQNQKLREKNNKLIEEMESRQCRLLLQSQIREEAQIQFVAILKQYQDKILELRRSVQDKEYLLQEKQTAGTNDHKKSHNYVEPKQQLMKFHTQNIDMKELLKKVSQENGNLRQQNQKLGKINKQYQFKLQKLQSIINSNVAFHTTRQLFGSNKRSSSSERIPVTKMKESRILNKQDSQCLQTKIDNKGFIANSTVQSLYVRNDTISSLRSLIFKYKESEQILKKQLKALQQQGIQIVQTHKLLRQSNIQHQIDRQKLQYQINFLKNQNHQLISIINKRKVKRSDSTQKCKIDTIIKDASSAIIPVQNRKQISTYFNQVQYQLTNLVSTIDTNVNRNYLKASCKNRVHRSFSNTADYVVKSQVDAVERYFNKKQSKHEQSKQQQFPFSIDYSVIENKNAPLTFADYKNKFKNKKFTESFMMITEEILRM